jgi:hypothetical protein
VLGVVKDMLSPGNLGEKIGASNVPPEVQL